MQPVSFLIIINFTNFQTEEVDNSESSSSSSSINRSNTTPTSQSRQSSLDNSLNNNRPALSDVGLPDGWSMQMAPNGRVFFIDHTNKTTSWVDPRTGCASPMPNAAQTFDKHEDDLGPLPEGWEERVHSDGRIFFIDHNTRTV